MVHRATTDSAAVTSWLKITWYEPARSLCGRGALVAHQRAVLIDDAQSRSCRGAGGLTAPLAPAGLGASAVLAAAERSAGWIVRVLDLSMT